MTVANTLAPQTAPTTGAPWRPGFLYGPTGGAGGTLGPARRFWATGSSPDALRRELYAAMAEGVTWDLVAQPHLQRLWGQISQLQGGQLDSVRQLLEAAHTRVEQIFLLKAFAANEPWQALVRYADEMRGLPEGEIVRRSTMRDDRELIQQWQDSCGPTVLQVAAGELDPRYAWELNKTWDLSAIDPLGANQNVASQQQQWLESYGGRAVQRGGAGGAGIALTRLLNDMLTPLTGVRYTTVPVPDKWGALAQIGQALRAGFDVPLRISWDQPGSGSDSGHFVLAMGTRQGASGEEFQIHDPWTGRTAWVPTATIAADRMPPMFDRYARLTHHYQPT
ncbi:MAG: papain-like cysteine protease family protein [Candidatus Sericytochromatia bacterium]|nr:papain-like cysteine protease family protein [Candidatus Sericytochromatia bacterium]